MAKSAATPPASRRVAVAAICFACVSCAQVGPSLRTDSLGISFVRLPAGEFMMGSDESSLSLARDFPLLEVSRFEALADEAPVHRVHITRAFWLGRYEVTVGQFRRFLELSGHVPEAISDGTGGYGHVRERALAPIVEGDAFAGRDPRWSWRDPGFAQTDDHPVVNVTWNDAIAMASWLSRREGRVYRLPREAEWEYACRAGSSTRYASGKSPATLAGHANLFDLDSAANWPRWAAHALPLHDGWAFTSPVGSFAPNAFGVHDMHGNVWEWAADRYDENYYANSPTDDPPGPTDGARRIRRGGSWHSWPFYARCSYRNLNTPVSRYPLVGFRLLIEDAGAAPPSSR